MPDVRRDVVVRIKAELATRYSDPFKPLTQGATRADQVIASRMQNIRRTIEGVATVRGGLGEAFQKSLGITQTDEALSRIVPKIQDTIRKIQTQGATPGSLRVLQRDVLQLKQAGETAAQGMLSGFQQAGQGITQAFRGVLFLTASNEKEFQKMLRTLAQFQGVLDLFSGIKNTIVGTAAALSNYANSARVAAAANQALALSGGVAAGGAVGGAARGAGGRAGGGVASGVAGGAVGGFAAKAGVAGGALLPAAGITVGLAAAAGTAGLFVDLLISKFTGHKPAFVNLGILFGTTAGDKAAEAFQQRMAKRASREQRTGAELELRGGFAQQRLEVELQISDVINQHDTALRGLQGIGKDLEVNALKRLQLENLHNIETKQIFANLVNTKGQLAAQTFLEERRLDLNRRLLDVGRERVQVIQQEQDRVKGILQTFGAMDALERARAKTTLQLVKERGVGALTPEQRQQVSGLIPGLMQREALKRGAELRPLLEQLGETIKIPDIKPQFDINVQLTEATLAREIANVMTQKVLPELRRMGLSLQQLEVLRRDTQRRANEAAAFPGQ